jgi:hypothetical protein
MNGQSQAIKSVREASTKLALSTSLLLSLTVLVIPANAQGYGSSNQFANVGSDADSYLPPEVVPSTQANMPAQAASSASASNSAPAFNPAAQSNMMSKNNAASMKQSFYNSMMGQGNYPQMQGSNAPAGGQAFAQNGPQTQTLGAPNQQLGQSNWVTAQNSGANGTPAQSQTLSGGVQNQTPNSANRKGVGLSHGVSTVTSLGASALFMGLMMSRNPLGGAYMGSMMGGSLLNQGFNGGGIRY